MRESSPCAKGRDRGNTQENYLNLYVEYGNEYKHVRSHHKSHPSKLLSHFTSES